MPPKREQVLDYGHAAILALWRNNMITNVSSAADVSHIAAYQYPLMQNENGQLMPAPDVFSDSDLLPCDATTNQVPALHIKVNQSQQMYMIGEGCFGKVFLLRSPEPPHNFITDVCFKVQTIMNIPVDQDGNLLESPLPLAEDKVKTDATVQGSLRQQARLTNNINHKPVASVVAFRPFVVEALATYAACRQLEGTKFEGSIPRIYGTFLVEYFNDKDQRLHMAGLSVMEYVGDAITFRDYIYNCQEMTQDMDETREQMPGTWFLKRATMPLRDLCQYLENSPLKFHNHDLHDENVLINPFTGKIYMIDLGLTNFCLPLSMICTIAMFSDLEQWLRAHAVGNPRKDNDVGIPIVPGNTCMFSEYNMRRLFKVQSDNVTELPCMNADDRITTQKFLDEECLDQIESWYCLPVNSGRKAYDAISKDMLLSMSDLVNEYGATCNVADIHIMAQRLYRDSENKYHSTQTRIQILQSPMIHDMTSTLYNACFSDDKRLPCSCLLELYEFRQALHDDQETIANDNDLLQQYRDIQRQVDQFYETVGILGVHALVLANDCTAGKAMANVFPQRFDNLLEQIRQHISENNKQEQMWLNVLTFLYQSTTFAQNDGNKLVLWLAGTVLLSSSPIVSSTIHPAAFSPSILHPTNGNFVCQHISKSAQKYMTSIEQMEDAWTVLDDALFRYISSLLSGLEETAKQRFQYRQSIPFEDDEESPMMLPPGIMFPSSSSSSVPSPQVFQSTMDNTQMRENRQRLQTWWHQKAKLVHADVPFF